MKREGDGTTPLGDYEIERLLYRADRGRRPRSGLPTTAIRETDGWCDAPADRNYNRPIRHPYPASAEHLWRHDRLYDLVVVLGHNRRPRVRGLGSAVFIHLGQAEGLGPTEGCVAFRRRDLVRLLSLIGPGTRVRIVP